MDEAKRIPVTLLVLRPRTTVAAVALSAAVIVITYELGKEAQRRFIERHPSVLKIEQEA